MEKENICDVKQFKMYIVYLGWVSCYKNHCYRSSRYGNVNFEYGYNESSASILSYDQVIYTIRNMQAVNHKYMIKPESVFLEIYEKDKKEHPDKYKDLSDDILNPSKKKYFVKDGFLQRGVTECIYDVQGDKYMPYYVLQCNTRSRTSIIINYESKDGYHVFETMNSYYYCENMIEVKYIDIIKELKDYLATYRESIDKYIQGIKDEEKEMFLNSNKNKEGE